MDNFIKDYIIFLESKVLHYETKYHFDNDKLLEDFIKQYIKNF